MMSAPAIRKGASATVEQINQRTAVIGGQHEPERLSFVASHMTPDTKPERMLPHRLHMEQLSPGEEFKQAHQASTMMNLQSRHVRQAVSNQYNLHLPTIEVKRPPAAPTGTVVKGRLTSNMHPLPRQNRVDPQLPPPPIKSTDIKQGILSLLQRGLIPPGSELVLEPSPVKKQQVAIHGYEEKFVRHVPIYNVNENAVLSKSYEEANREGHKISTRRSISETAMRLHDASMHSASMSAMRRRSAGSGTMVSQPLPPPGTPASSTKGPGASRHTFTIQNGKIRSANEDYLETRQYYILNWSSIMSLTEKLQALMRDHAIPVALVNGDKLANLAANTEYGDYVSNESMLKCLLNKDDVVKLMEKPGRKYRGPEGQIHAAIKIQTTWRAFVCRKRYLSYRSLKWSVGMFVIKWIMKVRMAKARRLLHQARIDQVELFRHRASMFATQWRQIKQCHRIEIHIPSLGYAQNVRESFMELEIGQNMQMGRLAELHDPNVDVIYICPVALQNDQVQYYSKLMSLKAAVDKGDADAQENIDNRFHIVVPDHIHTFPNHKMCLSSLLKYSPRTLRRIKQLIRGKYAYIVPGVAHRDDLSISEYLGVPVLGPEPDVQHLYTSKSGARRIFASGRVPAPPCEYDVYSLVQAHETLTQLIVENVKIQRWLFKIDDEFKGRGTAWLDVTSIPCYNWVLKESIRYGKKWHKKWAQDPSYNRILAVIPEVLMNSLKVVDEELYASAETFLSDFVSKGGIIEAYPPTESVTNLTAEILIEPDGGIKTLIVGDQIHAASMLQCWGLSVPQSSVDAAQINGICYQVAEACKSRHIIGYLSLDLVTFIDPTTMKQIVWATGLNLQYSDNLAMAKLMFFLTNSMFELDTHTLTIATPFSPSKRKIRDSLPARVARCATLSTQLCHSNMQLIHYSVFFQMCRAHGIGYDVVEKQGTVFTLADSSNRQYLGMVTVSDGLQGALVAFARNLHVIHQEISAPNMPGISNFQAAIKDIEEVLGVTTLNKDDDDEEKQDDNIAEPNEAVHKKNER